MRRFLVVALSMSCVSLLCADEPSAAAHPRKSWDSALTIHIGAGQVSYEEDVTVRPNEPSSTWDAPIGEVGATVAWQNPKGLRFRALFNLWASDTDTETWRTSEGVEQENDLTVGGIELQGDVGYELRGFKPTHITPWVGLNLRGQAYQRENFFFPDEPGAEEVPDIEEDFSVIAVMLGVDLNRAINHDWSVFAHAAVGNIVSAEAENEAFTDYGDLEGDGGTIVSAGLWVERALKNNQLVSLGFHYELQSIEGGIEGVPAVEWPDNELEQFIVEATWRMAL
jgi:hypothetical protein